MSAYARGGDDPDSIMLRVSSFRPRSIDDAVWLAIGPWVRATTLTSRPVLATQAASSLKALARFAAWAVGQGMVLETETVLSPEVLERYRLTGMRPLVATSRSAETSRLRRIARTVTTSTPWPPPLDSSPRGPLSPPYTATEVTRFWDVAHRQRSLFRRHAMTAVLALTLGAGARSGELFTVTEADVVDIESTTALRLGSPVRVVPVRHDCVRPLRRVCAAAGGEPLVVSRREGRDQAAALVGSFDMPRDVPHLTVARLRSTWLASVLTDLSVPEVFAAAGIVSGKAFSDLVAYLPASELGSPGWRSLVGGGS
ncbi:hypothetical protein [Antrihabitans stalactiti]|uniref:Tyr recombinase domain-containing protein n=1 Tax=Antrihabitans stalactiti TaxID=2584121 RepID=A0A848KK24_9NOCA|nr:hypothetical protein [Antrihabitans stalactiti]